MNPIPLEGDINQILSTISRDFHRRNVPTARVSNKWKVYKGQAKLSSKYISELKTEKMLSKITVRTLPNSMYF